jgi:hypothetical protein
MDVSEKEKIKAEIFWNSLDIMSKECIVNDYAEYLNIIGVYEEDIEISEFDVLEIIQLEWKYLIKYEGNYHPNRMQASDLEESVYYHLELADFKK